MAKSDKNRTIPESATIEVEATQVISDSMDVELDQPVQQSELETLENRLPVPSVSRELALVAKPPSRKRARKRESARHLMNRAFRQMFPITDKSWASEIDSDSDEEQRMEEVKKAKAEKVKARRAHQKAVKKAAKSSEVGAETGGEVQNDTTTLVKASSKKVGGSFFECQKVLMMEVVGSVGRV